MVRRILLVAVGFAALADPVASQSEKKAPLAFEVASVKPSDLAARAGGIRPLPGGQTYVAEAAPLKLMIRLMYKITDSQIVGGPDWMGTALFDVRAKAEKPSSVDDLHEMFQTLLADRFKLKFHREMRTLPALVLTVDKPGSKMKPNESTEPFDVPIKLASGGRPPAPPKFAGTHVPMEYLRWWLGQAVGNFRPGQERPVVDKTGLTGFYDFTLEFAPDLSGLNTVEGTAPPQFDGPTIFTALREQLGLKLESAKGPVEVFVIDHAEKPTEN